MGYRPAVDLLRLLAAALVVCFHSPAAPFKNLTLSGLAYFLLLTFCLQGMSAAKHDAFPLVERSRRLVMPWLIWSFLYGLLHLARHKPFGIDVFDRPCELLMGTELHLWFLPFAFFGGVATFFLRRSLLRLPEAWGMVCLMILAASLATVPLLTTSLPVPLAQWSYAAPLLPLGLAIGMAQRLPGGHLAFHYLAILGTAWGIAWVRANPSILLGVLALAFSILLRTRDFPRLRWLAGLTMGTYLLHPLALLFVYKYAAQVPWYVFALIGTLGSALASGMIATVPRLDSLLFGTAYRPTSTSPSPATNTPVVIHLSSDAFLLGEPAR